MSWAFIVALFIPLLRSIDDIMIIYLRRRTYDPLWVWFICGVQSWMHGTMLSFYVLTLVLDGWRCSWTRQDFLRQCLGILDALSMLSWNGEGAMERWTWYCLFLHIVWSSMSEMRLFVCCWELDGPCVSGRSGRGSQTHQFSKRFKVQTKILCENVFLCSIYLP